MTNLFADAGATKTLWRKVVTADSGDSAQEEYIGAAISPTFHDSETIEQELRLVRTALGEHFDHIRYYGTGVGSEVIIEKMRSIISEVFSCPDIIVDNDLVGACHAALGSEPGIACIMGTGSNSCHFDGRKVDRTVPSLGFILDDEGGGVAFGRRLLSDYFKRITPPEITEKLNARGDLNTDDVVTRLYKETSPNRWIAGFMPFIIENISHPYMRGLVNAQVARFFDREFGQYPEEELCSEGIGFVGGIAWTLQDEIKKEMARRGWKLRRISRFGLSTLI